MLRNRSRAAVSSKQAIDSDRSSTSRPSWDKTAKPVLSFLGYPMFFRGFLTREKGGEVDTLISPTSILDMKPIFPIDNPFGYGRNIQPSRTSGKKRHWETSNSNAIGLALITFPDETSAEKPHKQATRMVRFLPNIKVQIPPDISPTSLPPPADSPYSPPAFGTKHKNQQHTNPNYFFQTRKYFVNMSRLSVAEMELSEDYTKVTSHGHNQTATHIFYNNTVKSYGFDSGCTFTSAKTTKKFSPIAKNSLSNNFLSHCYTCKKRLNQKRDIYIYRGEKAFCSRACRAEEMLEDGADYD